MLSINFITVLNRKVTSIIVRNKREILVGARRTKAASTTSCVAQFLDLFQDGIVDALEDQLSDAVSFGNGKFNLGVVEQHDADVSSVIFINDSSANVDKVFGG